MRPTRLATQLSLAIALTVVASVGVTSVLAVAVSQRSLRRQVLSANMVAASLIAHAVDIYVQGAANAMREAQGRPKLGEEIRRGRWAEAERVLENFVHHLTRFEYVFVQDAAGVIRVRVPRADTIGQDFSFRDFFREAARTRALVVSGVYVSRATGRPVVSVAIPIEEAGQLRGVLVGALSLTRMSEFVASIGRQDGSVIYVVDRQGFLVAQSGEPRTGTPESVRPLPIVQAVLAGGTGTLEYGSDRARSLGAYVPIGGLGWGVVVTRPLSAAYAPATRLGWWLAAIGLACAVMAAAIGIGLARTLSRPLQRVVEATERLASGDLAVRLAPGHHEEIGTLARSFNHMVERLHGSYGALAQKTREVEALNQTLEQRVVERTRQLERANRELEAFTYTVSHDLKAPLRGMAGFAQALQEDCPDRLDAAGHRYLSRIQTGARRMADLIDDLLRYSRIERREVRYEPVALPSLFGQICEELGDELRGRRLEVRLELAADTVEAEPEGLRQAMINLVSNAVKFSRPDGGTIVIRTERHDGEVVLSVADSGIGFDMKYHDRIFQIFERLHRQEEYAGTGVGLAIVRKVAERHGGRAWAVSDVGKGSTFYLALPARLEGRT